VFGVEGHPTEIDTMGLTDLQILRRVLENHGIEKAAIDSKIGRCFDCMAREYKSLIEEYPVRAMPGAKELLGSLKGRHMIGLVTGNEARIAKAKLEFLDIWKYIQVSAFGSEHPERVRLLQLACGRARKLGWSKGKPVYIADAVSDMQAAIGAGVVPVGVATGSYSKDDLLDAGAEYAFESLEENGITGKIDTLSR